MTLIAEGLIRAPTVVGASRLRVKKPPNGHTSALTEPYSHNPSDMFRLTSAILKKIVCDMENYYCLIT